MIYCIKCGKGIPDESKFCPSCGNPVPIVDSPKPNVVTPSQVYIPPSQVYIPPTAYTQQAVTNTAGAKPTFFNNVGFWGAIILLIGFFLPFYTSSAGSFPVEISLYKMAGTVDAAIGSILLYMLPVCAVVLIIQGILYIFPPVMANICKILPLLLMVFCLGAVMREDSTGGGISTFFKIAGIGFYVTLLGAILVPFFRRKG